MLKDLHTILPQIFCSVKLEEAKRSTINHWISCLSKSRSSWTWNILDDDDDDDLSLPIIFLKELNLKLDVDEDEEAPRLPLLALVVES